jgi:DMSO/TMAO reductase YedYZ molybdopterin-dependent catalytic subunit
MLNLQRRDFLVAGGAAAALTMLRHQGLAQSEEVVVPWLDQPPPIPPPATKSVKNLFRWEDLGSWITPNDKFFEVNHYNWPIIDENSWRLDVGGLVAKPLTFSLSDLKHLPRAEVTSTIECSGNHGFPFFTSAVGNAKWSGTSLAAILNSAEVQRNAIEVVFFGVDQGEETVRKGTPLELTFTANFARSMSIEDAMSPANLLCFEMNDAPLPPEHGFPLRLIAPGWFGIANVKWLRRIELRDTRFMGRFMGRDYVTIREESRDGEKITVESSVGRMLLNSVPARVVQRGGRYRIIGAAWGASPVAAVEVKVDGGAWMPAMLDENQKSEFAWRFWSIDWSPTAGEHSVTSRAIDKAGHVQPAMDDPRIVGKRTYWESNGQVARRIRIT